MKRSVLMVVCLIATMASYSQTKSMVGSWIWQNSSNTISLFMKPDGTIEKRTATNTEDFWDKVPKTGTYTFKNGADLMITWKDKSIEKGKVKFVEASAVEIQFTNPKTKSKKTYLFKKVMDEEVTVEQ